MSQKELRALIRERMRSGQLPPVLDGKAFGGRGSNAACDCCGQIIARDEIEYEVQLAAPVTQTQRNFIAHMRCHWVWWEESGPQSSPAEQRDSPSLVWSALKDHLTRPGQPAS